jgi:hypothetical protein
LGFLLPAVFFLQSGKVFAAFVAEPGAFGYDARLYSIAARAMIEGHDPYAAPLGGGIVIVPPTTLLTFVPFAYVDLAVVTVVCVLGNLLLAAYILRRLGLPAWWIAFPPFFVPILVGSCEILMVAALLFGNRLSGLAVVIKPYAALPLIAERRWYSLAIAGLIFLVSLLVLAGPWSVFLLELPRIQQAAVLQMPNVNASSDPLLFVVALAALASLGIRRALWLATPVLLPRAQIHYAAMTLPALTPLLAFFWALPIPFATTIGIVVVAVVDRVQRIGSDAPAPWAPTLPDRGGANRRW